jgi:hypothetical protein
MKNLLYSSALLLISISVQAQNLTLNTVTDITGILNESSGVVFIPPNKLYTHNDSGGNDEIYELDTLGNLMRTITINSGNNTDWEDITKDNNNNIYIGDFGNNNNDRTNLRIYKIQNPASFTGNSVTAQQISFEYPDQTMFPPAPAKRNFDAEGFVWYNDSLYIFTKNRTAPFNGYCKLYKIPAIPGNHVAQICDSVFLCGTSQPDCFVTSAALSPDNKHLILLNHSKMWWFSCFNGTDFFHGEKTTITLNTNTQKEAVAFDNHQQVYVTDEFVSVNNSGGKLYKANVSTFTQQPFVNILSDTIFCSNCSISVDSFAGTLTWNSGQSGPMITPSNAGWYKVTASTANNCTYQDSVYVAFIQALQSTLSDDSGIFLTLQNKNQLSGYLKEISHSSCELQLYDILGKSILTHHIFINNNPQQFNIDCNLTKGLYVLTLRTKSGVRSRKILIED